MNLHRLDEVRLTNPSQTVGTIMALAGVLLFFVLASIGFFPVAYLSLLLALVGIVVAAAGIRAESSRVQAPRQVQPSSIPMRVETPIQPATREIYKEREIIREIVKIRCRNCGTLFEEKANRCPHCGAPP